jgi:phosphoglycerate dehydrogenase-like enzyme
MNELLECSDIISPHFPLNAGTKGLIGRAEFARMKDGVFFINTARGAVVDEDALIEALESGKVARCGLDVHCVEPNSE